VTDERGVSHESKMCRWAVLSTVTFFSRRGQALAHKDACSAHTHTHTDAALAKRRLGGLGNML
jgi:hypothetical protein